MGRGLDGLISRYEEKLCSFEGPPGLEQFPVAIAWGKHLFPFRTEQLSPTAPMVLGSQGPGRVGRRRFLLTSRPLGGSSWFWRPADSVGSFRQPPAAGSAKSRPCRAVTSAPRSRRP